MSGSTEIIIRIIAYSIFTSVCVLYLSFHSSTSKESPQPLKALISVQCIALERHLFNLDAISKATVLI